MKFTETEFTKQLLYTVIGTLFIVANITFISLTASIGPRQERNSASTEVAKHASSLSTA